MPQPSDASDDRLVFVDEADVGHLLLVSPDLATRGQRQVRVDIEKRLVVALHAFEPDLHVDGHFLEAALSCAQLELGDPGRDNAGAWLERLGDDGATFSMSVS